MYFKPSFYIPIVNKNLISKFISCIVLISLIFNLVGHLLIYIQLKSFKKSQIIKAIKYGELNNLWEKIAFKKDELKNICFYENGNEFRLNGKMYDVISYREEGDSVYFYCINDVKEEELNSIFIKFVYNNEDSKQIPNNIREIFKILNIDYFLNLNPILIPENFIEFLNIQKNSFPQKIILEKPTPPPKL